MTQCDTWVVGLYADIAPHRRKAPLRGPGLLATVSGDENEAAPGEGVDTPLNPLTPGAQRPSDGPYMVAPSSMRLRERAGAGGVKAGYEYAAMLNDWQGGQDQAGCGAPGHPVCALM